MSGIINRIREGVHEATRSKDGTTTTSGVPEGTAGPHSSRAANAADPRVDSDLDNRAVHHSAPGGISPVDTHHTTRSHHTHTTTTGTTGTMGATGSTNAGPHNSNIANKLDPRVDSDLDGGRHAGMNQTTSSTGRTGMVGNTGTIGSTGSTNAGPHDSNLANKLDPRVDSDLDGSRNAGMNQTTSSTGRTGAVGNTGTIGTTGSTNAGPHNSNIANKLDPRVDSDLDGGRHAGMNQTTSSTGRTGAVGNTGTTGGRVSPTRLHYNPDVDGAGGSTTTRHTGSTNAGPHNSNLLNKLDPRVDSDLDGSRNAGMNQTTNRAGNTGVTGGVGSGSTNAGPHSSNAANKMDPRVDSDLDGGRHAGMNQTTTATGRPVGGTTGTVGTSGSTNAGPHKSNLLNKLDPRVDSDLSGTR